MSVLLEQLRSGGRPAPTPLDEIRALDQERLTLRRELVSLKGEGERLSTELRKTREALDDGEQRRVGERLAHEQVTAALRRVPRAGWGKMAISGLLGLCLGAMGITGLGTLIWSLVGRQPGQAKVGAPATAAEPVRETATLSAPEVDPAPAATAAPSADPGVCPFGMTLIGSTTLHIGQPKPQRRWWPDASPEHIAPIKVEAFCLDIDPVLWSDVPEEVSADVRETDCFQNTQSPEDDGPAVCLSRSQSEAVCGARLPSAQLPTITEWEAERRPTGRVQVPGEPFTEWVRDDFPPKVFNRSGETGEAQGMFRQSLQEQINPLSPKGNVLYSWNQRPVDKGLNVLGFRCARAPL